MSESKQIATIRAGSQVAAIIPQTITEVWQVAKGVVAAGLAPKSLGNPEKDDIVSAVAITIMAGAELGLKPMVSLRSFTVINGRPALYGDGLINVVRQSGKVAYLRTGCDEVGGQLVGWCEAKRNDTGEESRVEFSQADAERAGLWSPEPTKRGKVWRENKHIWVDDAPNDSPWYRYPKRMLQWRAAGYCLRELFGDVLGGVRDEFEAREIADAEFEVIEQPRNTPPSPPPAPEEAEGGREGDHSAQGHDEALPADGDPPLFDFAALEADIVAANDEDTLEEVWDAYDLPSALTHDEEALTRAFEMKKAHAARIAAAQTEEEK